MPRRRALRVLGASLSAAAVPTLRASPAGARTRRSSVACRGDQRTCQKGAEKNFEEYCCPPPSWQFHCGGEDTSYRCVNMCTGRFAFPCTATVRHPESGINGVCCDRRYHSKCQPIGPSATCCYGNPVKCKPMGKAACAAIKDANKYWAPAELWKPRCIACKGPMCGSGAKARCCDPPNVCRNGACQCPMGRRWAQCNDVGSDSSVRSGERCCPSSAPTCCVTKCCKYGCCHDKCCAAREVCARSVGGDVCCPQNRLVVIGGAGGDSFHCCPAGTRASSDRLTCCPPNNPTCCRDRSAAGSIACPGGKICVDGACVTM